MTPNPDRVKCAHCAFTTPMLEVTAGRVLSGYERLRNHVAAEHPAAWEALQASREAWERFGPRSD